jgi:hypothetical protein
MASQDADGFTLPSKKHTAQPPTDEMEKWKSENQFSALRSDRNMTDSALNPSNGTEEETSDLPHVLSPSQQNALSHLLKICAENNLSINPHLRKAILGEELYNQSICTKNGGSLSRTSLSKRESLLGSLIASHLTEVEGEELGQTAREVREKMEVFENTNISIEARVVDGRYEVKLPPSSSKGRIETVASSGALMKLGKRLGDMLICKEKPKEETKVIMEGVNLYLEEGKMYLVLGAPGTYVC